MTLIDRVTYFSLKVFKFKSNSNIVTIANSSERFTKFSWISEKLQFVRQIEKLKRLSFFRSWRRKKKEREREKERKRKKNQSTEQLSQKLKLIGFVESYFSGRFCLCCKKFVKNKRQCYRVVAFIYYMRLYTYLYLESYCHNHETRSYVVKWPKKKKKKR